MTRSRSFLAAVLAAVLALAPVFDVSSVPAVSVAATMMSQPCADMAMPCDPASMGEDCDRQPCCNMASGAFAVMAAEVETVAFDLIGDRNQATAPVPTASTRAPPLRPPLA